MIRVAVVEDDEVIREGYQSILDQSPSVTCVAVCGDCESALQSLKPLRPQVVLLDIGLPGMSGIEGVPKLRKLLGDVDIIMVSVHADDRRVFAALRAGARGYLTKNVTPERLIGAITEVTRGGAPMSVAIARMVVESMRSPRDSAKLTQRENEVLKQLCDGHSYKIIADRLCISELTVHSHIKNIYRKLEVHSQTEAVSKAFRHGLV